MKNNIPMKNIFSKTTAHLRLNVSTITAQLRSIYGIPILIFAFLTLGFGQVWADSSVTGGEVKVYDGSDHWVGWNTTYNAGTISTLYVDGFWAEVGTENVCSNTCLYYMLNSTSFDGSHTYNIESPDKWDVATKHFQKTGIGKNIFSEFSVLPGSNTLYAKVIAHGKKGSENCGELHSGNATVNFTYYPDLWVPGNDWGLGDWDNTSNDKKMSCNTTTGVYTKSVNNVTADDHKFKVSTYSGGLWLDYSYFDAASSRNLYSSSSSSGDIVFQPAMEGTVTVTYTGSTHKISITCAAPTITFDKEGGDGGTSTQSTYYNETPSNISKPSKTGYTFGGYYTGDDGTGTQIIDSNGAWLSNKDSYTNGSGKWIVRNNYTLHAKWTPNQYTITLNGNGGTGNTGSVKATYNAAALSTSITNPTKTGYNFNGWHKTNGTGQLIINTGGVLQSSTDYTSAGGVWTNDGNVTLFAGWTAKQCSITLDYQTSAEGYSSSGDITNAGLLTATYDAAMPPLTGTMPTAAQGYKFMGFYTGTNGTGTKYYNADGSSANNWAIDTEETTTLYAYYEVAKVSLSFNHDAFEPLDAASGVDDKDYVIATPTVSPVPEGDVTICWDLLYENDNPVPDHPVVDAGGNAKKFSIVGLQPGTYKVRATLRAGSGCSGTILHVCDKSFSIASDHSTTIVYKCGSEEIHSPNTVSAKPLEWSSAITPEEIFGYSFSSWTAGDGITISTDGSSAIDGSTTTTSTIYIKAYYSGTLTANYTKKKMIFFKNTLGWETPYVYFYKSGGYWDANKGAGGNGSQCLNSNYGLAMVNIDGTDIWYYDYGGTGFANQVTEEVAFTWGNHSGDVNFNGCDVVYATSYTCGFSSGTPMFVPLPKGAGGQSSDDVNGAHYYSKGYWTNYLGEGTGYTLKVYSSSGSWIKDVKFTSEDKLMSMKATTDLEAGTDYKFYVDRADGFSHGNNGSINYSNENTAQIMNKNSSDKRTIRTAASGDYVFTLTYSGSELYISVDYPSTVNDYRLVYKDQASSSYWSKGTAHTAAWSHPSRVISKAAGAEDIVSFFVVKGASATLQFQHITSITAGTGAISWANDGSAINIDDTYNLETGVYNFYLKQSDPAGTITIDKVEPYTGEFYIRTDAANNKWDNYRAADHRMTYSSFSESDENSFGEKYSHYYMHWCPYNTNVKFVIANDYSPCISDTLIKDNTFLNNMNDDGFLLDDGGRPDLNNKYSANIRFMWNRKTNKISRAYIASSTNKARKFLVLRANQTIWDEDSKPVSEGFTNGVILEDKQNWMYETTISITPSTKFKLFACYAEASPSESGAQYFRGHYASDSWTDENTVVLIGGSGAKQKARVIYDFKTNRLMAAWIPSGSAVSGTVEINADVLVEREHQEAAQYITFADASSKLSKVKTVYGAMKFNRWILNNRQHPEDENPDHGKTDDQLSTYHPPLTSAQKSIYERSLYFISFPFDVKVSDIFGFGNYWDEWYLEYYDGKTRAQNGYWIDSEPNWKYVTPEMADTMVLRKYVGYILGLDLDYMQANNYNFWTNGISTIELFFPSTTNQETLQQTTVTIPALSEDYKCTINRGTTEGDRRVKDSYWRCIGTPSFNLYNTAVSDGSGNITWKTDYTWKADESEFPFIYMWNKADNTLTAQSTSTFNFLPMHAYLVQNGKQIVWTNVSAKPSAIVARQESDIMPNEYNWRITLSRDSVTEDQTYVRMTSLEQVTDSFDFGQDLVKELNTGRSDIYTFIGYERVAANSRPIETSQTTIIPMGLNIETTGDYTFSIPEGTDGVGVVLVDEATGIRTSLSALSYTVNLTAGDYTGRFVLEISPIKNTPTGIEEPTSNSSLKGRAQKVMIDGILYIVKDGKIFDARGARVQ